MNIMEVMELPVGSEIVNSKGTKYVIEKRLGGKCLVNKEGKYIAEINEFMFKEEYNMVRKFKKGDKIYVNWFFDTEGLDEVEFLKYCEDGKNAQILIEGVNGFNVGYVELSEIKY